GVRPRPPQPVTLVAADGVRQAVCASEVINRGCFTVVPCEDSTCRALFGGHCVVHTGDCCGHLRPPEHIRILLRQQVEVYRLPFFRRNTQRLLIGDEFLNRHHRHCKRPPNHSVEQDEYCGDGAQDRL